MHVNNLGGPRVTTPSVERQSSPARTQFSALVQAGPGAPAAGRGQGNTVTGARVVASALASQQATPHSSLLRPYAQALGAQAVPEPGTQPQVPLTPEQVLQAEQNMQNFQLLTKLALLQYIQGTFALGAHQGPELEQY